MGKTIGELMEEMRIKADAQNYHGHEYMDLQRFAEDEEVFIIGGGQIYAEALPLAKRIYLTEVDADYEGDTYFPQWDRSSWQLIEQEHFPHGEKFTQPFAFLTYERR